MLFRLVECIVLACIAGVEFMISFYLAGKEATLQRAVGYDAHTFFQSLRHNRLLDVTG